MTARQQSAADLLKLTHFWLCMWALMHTFMLRNFTHTALAVPSFQSLYSQDGEFRQFEQCINLPLFKLRAT